MKQAQSSRNFKYLRSKCKKGAKGILSLKVVRNIYTIIYFFRAKGDYIFGLPELLYECIIAEFGSVTFCSQYMYSWITKLNNIKRHQLFYRNLK